MVKNCAGFWEQQMCMSCTPRRPDLMLEHQDEQRLLTVDMACPNEAYKTEKQVEKMWKYQELPYKLLERRPTFIVEVAPIVIGCPGVGIKQLEEDIRSLFNEMERLKNVVKLQKNVIWETEFIFRRVMSGLIDWIFSI